MRFVILLHISSNLFLEQSFLMPLTQKLDVVLLINLYSPSDEVRCFSSRESVSLIDDNSG